MVWEVGRRVKAASGPKGLIFGTKTTYLSGIFAV